jgi:hypothetical protein
MTYDDLKAALDTFGFSRHDLLTMAQVKRKHRELSKSNHPDLSPVSDPHTMQSINASAAILLEYLRSYRFSFSEEEFYRQNPDELLRNQFATDPWGT